MSRSLREYFFNDFFECVLPASMLCATCTPGVDGGQKRTPELLELELGMVVIVMMETELLYSVKERSITEPSFQLP